MKEQLKIARMPSGIKNLDAILGGGIPKGSMIVFGGPPGSAKTILSQQIGFNTAELGQKVLFIHTLSEPTVKTLLYMQQFSYFKQEHLHTQVKFVDLGVILKTKTLDDAAKLIMEHVKNEAPALTIIDSFRVFDDLAESNEDLRKFTYQLLVNLIAWETTTLLLGEFSHEDIRTNPLFSVVDGIIMMDQKEISGENTRLLQVFKLRGSAHNRDRHPFLINDDGIEIFAPRVTLVRRDDENGFKPNALLRVQTGIKVLDMLIGEGVPRSSMVLVSGRSGVGKTLLLLEFLYRGAVEKNEKGIFLSIGTSLEDILTTALAMGWDFRPLIANKQVEFVCIKQADVFVDADLLQLEDKLQIADYKRVALDSVSGFLEKITEPQLYREKFYQLKTLIHNSQAVCFLSFDVKESQDIGFAVMNAEDIVDGHIELTLEKKDLSRVRYIEVRKMRFTDHSLSKCPILVKNGGISSLSVQNPVSS